jgi:hypothetical protein
MSSRSMFRYDVSRSMFRYDASLSIFRYDVNQSIFRHDVRGVDGNWCGIYCPTVTILSCWTVCMIDGWFVVYINLYKKYFIDNLLHVWKNCSLRCDAKKSITNIMPEFSVCIQAFNHVKVGWKILLCNVPSLVRVKKKAKNW